MPDGRIICIGGEHEDWYDPDFCIFNDVVVLRPAPGKEDVDVSSGDVEIYGYPETVFPPTDFHSATLVDRRIFVIGSLGYKHNRKPHDCQIRLLDTADYRITSPRVKSSGPGWISSHHASYDMPTHSITVRGGKRYDGSDYVENHAVYRLHLDGLKWEKLTDHERRFRYRLQTVDEWAMSQTMDDDPEIAIDSLLPVIPFIELDIAWKDFPTRRFDINGVRVEIDDWGSEVRLLIEGDPGESVREEIVRGMVQKLCESSGCMWRMIEVDSFDEGF